MSQTPNPKTNVVGLLMAFFLAIHTSMEAQKHKTWQDIAGDPHLMLGAGIAALAFASKDHDK